MILEHAANVDRKRSTSRTNELSHAKVVAADLDKAVAADLH